MDGDDDIRYGVPSAEGRADDDGPFLNEDGPGTRAAGAGGFDPTPYMRQLRGRGGAQDYLDVKWRLLWLRREHPDAEIVTEHVRIEESSAIFKATVSLPSGGKATGYGSETAGDFGDFIEKAETKAIGRALNALGYGAQFAEGDDEASAAAFARQALPRPAAARPAATTTQPLAARPVEMAPEPVVPPADATEAMSQTPAGSQPVAPSPRELGAAEAGVVRSQVGPAVAAPVPSPTQPRPVGVGRPVEAGTGLGRGAAPIDFDAHRDRGTTPTRPVSPPVDRVPSRPAPAVRADAAEASDATPDPDPADYSFTEFWKWARALGYNSKGAVEQLIGRPMTDLNPADVRKLVRAARGEA